MASVSQDCPQCHTANPVGMRFCGACGTALTQVCSKCGFSNPPGFKFCGGCAAPLVGTGAAAGAERSPGGSAPPHSVTGREAERRQLTVIFVDLIDSVRLSESLLEEDLRDLLRAYQGVVVEAIEQAGGHVAQYLGDGILAYFGYPIAQEDDAIRAVRAALRCVAGMARLRESGLAADAIHVRVGVHTGMGVVGEIGAGNRQERLAIGSTPNIAARIQSLAGADEVWVSSATRGLTADMFEFSPEHEATLKGIVKPVTVCRVLAEQGTRHLIAQNKRLGERPLMGRAQQLTTLQQQFEGAVRQQGSTVLVSGEAGIGKSRLIYAFASGLPADARQLSARCAPHAQNSPLLPLVELFGQMFGITTQVVGTEDEARIRQQLQHSLDPDAFELLTGFLSLKTSGNMLNSSLSSARRRDRTLQLLRLLLLDEARKRPVVIFVEDLHWVDPSTLEFIDTLLEPGAQVGLLLVLTARPTFVSPWGFRPYLKRLNVERLGWAEAEALMRSVSGDKQLPDAVLKDLLGRADGVPLYVEEMTKAVIESGLLRAGAGNYELNLPSTLRDSLAARLDHLGAAKGVAQLAAVIGRSFPYSVLAAIAPEDIAILRRHMDHLVRGELVQLDASVIQETYVFRHALIRDAAYDSLLRKEREELHGRVATALKTLSSQECEQRPEVLAWHLEGAGQVEAAVASWTQAGQIAMARAAHRESIAHLNHAVQLLKRQPDSPVRHQTELGLQLTLGGNYIATQGWSSAGVMDAFSRARDICEALGHQREVFPALWGLWSYHLVAGNFREGQEVTVQLRAIAEPTGDPSLLVPLGHARGYNLMFAGEYREALQVCTQGTALFNLELERALVAGYQQSSTSAMCNIASISLWALGFPDQAKQMAVRQSEISDMVGNRACDAVDMAGLQWGVATMLRDTAWVQRCEEKGLDISAEIENVFWPALLRFYGSWARVMNGDNSALATMEECINIWRGGGAGVLTTMFYALFLEACLKVGETRKGLDFAPGTFEYAAKSGERYFETELHRVTGELLVANLAGAADEGVQALALDHMDKARDLARAEGARSFELRAAMGRVRICQGGAHQTAALKALAEVYAGFTEGFDTPDLQGARALLDLR